MTGIQRRGMCPRPERPEGLSSAWASVWTSGTYRGGQFSPLHESGFVLCKSLPDRHLPAVDIHEGIVQVGVASYPVKHRLHLSPRLDVLFPLLEDLRVRKFGHLTSSVAGMIDRPLNRQPYGSRCVLSTRDGRNCP